jgi:hypothetical protein
MKGEISMDYGDKLILSNKDGIRMVEIQKMGKLFFINPIPGCVMESPGEGCGSTTISKKRRMSSSLKSFMEVEIK